MSHDTISSLCDHVQVEYPDPAISQDPESVRIAQLLDAQAKAEQLFRRRVGASRRRVSAFRR